MSKKLVEKVMGFIGFEEDITEDEEKVSRSDRYADEEEVVGKTKRKGQVLSIHAQKQLKVVVVEPRFYDEVQDIAENLKNRRPVIINLEQTDPDVGRRVVDFISGATFALNGSMQKVGNGIFLFVPSNMDIDTEIKEQIKDRGALSWMRQ